MRTCTQIPRTCTEVRTGDMSVTQLGMGTARQVPEAHGTSNLAKMQSSGFSKRTCLVPKEQVWGPSYLSFLCWLLLCSLCFMMVGTRDQTQESHIYWASVLLWAVSQSSILSQNLSLLSSWPWTDPAARAGLIFVILLPQPWGCLYQQASLA